jgi:hypothetical protein
MNELGCGKAQLGKFALEDEFRGGRLVAVQLLELFGLQRAWRRRLARGRLVRRALPGRLLTGLVALPLEKEFEHDQIALPKTA